MYAEDFTKEHYFYRLISAFAMNSFSAFYLFSSIIDCFFQLCIQSVQDGVHYEVYPRLSTFNSQSLMLLGIVSLRVETFRKNLLINNDVMAGIPGFLAFSRLDFYRPLVLFHFPNSGCMVIKPMPP